MNDKIIIMLVHFSVLRLIHFFWVEFKCECNIMQFIICKLFCVNRY